MHKIITFTFIITFIFLSCFKAQANYTCSTNDSLTLLSFYNSVNGLNWDLTQPISTWQGITLNSNGCVEGIVLFSNNLSGVIPSSIGDLSALETLNLALNQLAGGIPEEIGNLTNLSFLNLAQNQLSGSIPMEIGYLSNLNYMNLRLNALTGMIPSEIGNLYNLNTLFLNDNNLVGGIPAELGNLSLTALNVSENSLSGCYDPNLSNLCVYGYDNDEISEDNNFNAGWQDFCTSNFGSCVFDSCFFFGIIANFFGPYNDIILMQGINGEGPYSYSWSNGYMIPALISQPLGNYTITVTDANGCSLTETYSLGDPLCAVQDSLTLLTINNSIAGLGWDLTQPISTWNGVVLSNNGCVTELYINDASAGTLPPEIGDLSFLEVLDIEDSGITGNLPSEIGNLSNLVSLTIDDNNFSGSIPSEIGNLTNLTYLDLHDNQFSGTMPIEIFNLVNLNYLSLSFNQLSGMILDQFDALTNLNFLSLANNQFSGSLPATIGSLSGLNTLSVVNNNLSGCFDSSLSNLCVSFLNIDIDNGNNFDAIWSDFCNYGAGDCCPIFTLIDYPIINSDIFYADVIEANDQMIGGNINLVASNYILINEGFETNPNIDLLLEIGNCP